MRRTVLVAAVLLVLALAVSAETKIGPKGQVIIGGKPVIPLAVWDQPPYMFEYFSQLGITCVVGGRPERGAFRNQGRTMFPGAERNGMTLVTDYRDDARGEKTVIGWMGGLMVPGRIEDLKRHNQAIHQGDPSRFVISNIDIHPFLRGGDDDFYKEAFKHADAIISHVWPEVDAAKPNLRNVAVMIDRVRELSKGRPGGEVSIWPDLNPHHWHGKQPGGGQQYPAPTEEELRFQIWLALIHGADAICIFPISFEPFVYCQIPAKNEIELAWNTRLIERMTPALTAEESPLAIKVTGDRQGGLVDVTTRTTGGKHYVFLVNGGREEQTVTLTVPGLGKEWLLRDAVAEKAIEVGGGTFSGKLPGLALRIWELSPPSAPQAAPE